MTIELVPARIPNATIEDLDVSPFGVVRVSDWIEHPSRGDTIGRIASGRTKTVWITEDGDGDAADSWEEALTDLLTQWLDCYYPRADGSPDMGSDW